MLPLSLSCHFFFIGSVQLGTFFFCGELCATNIDHATISFSVCVWVVYIGFLIWFFVSFCSVLYCSLFVLRGIVGWFNFLVSWLNARAPGRFHFRSVGSTPEPPGGPVLFFV